MHHRSLQDFLESIELPRESVVVLADMLELGERANQKHENLLRLAIEKKFSRLYLLGSLYSSAWRFLRQEFPVRIVLVLRKKLI